VYNIFSMTRPFLRRLAEAPLLGDGAMGTQLYAHGIAFDQCFDELNLSQPELVCAVHRAYLDAGADVVETNTFGANAIKLRQHGLEDKVEAINRAGVELARLAVSGVGREAFVLASVGPLGRRLAPLGALARSEAASAFRQQVKALVSAGPDALIVETMADLEELRLAVAVVREQTDLPLIAQMTFAEDGQSILGYRPEDFAAAMRGLQVDVMGVNCSVGPGRLFPVVETLLSHAGGMRISAQPNAGWPEQVDDRIIYPSSPDYFGRFALRAANAGVALIGGCCGTTPEHIAVMRQALDGRAAAAPKRRSTAQAAVEVLPGQSPVAHEPPVPTGLQLKLAAKRFVVSVEIDPPKSADASGLLKAARTLKAGGVDVLNVADTPMARMRMSAWALCYLAQSQVGMETVLHFPTRGRNLLRVQGDLLAAHALGLRNILVVMGDPTSHGDYPQAADQSDIVPSGLVRLIKQQFNLGVDHGGAPMSQATGFHVGVALNMAAADPDREIKNFLRKVEAGADFALTQPVYEPGVCSGFIRHFQERHGPLPVPVLMGLMPLASARNAEFIHNEVPGLQLPLSVLERMRAAGTRGRKEGVQICRELLLESRSLIQGIYVMPTFERYDSVMEIMEVLR
jgi:methionine synthase / methylenetetrahydrofolate reductase(NADPH)